MPSQVRLSKIRWRNAWPTPTGRNMSSQTKVDFEDDKIRHLPPAPLERVLAAVADARLKYRDEIDRARRNRTRRNVAIREKRGEGSLNFS